MLFNPSTLISEAKHLEFLGIEDPLSLVTLERSAIVTTHFHMAANRIREMARTKRHGSCGMGIGETMEHSLKYPEGAFRVSDMAEESLIRLKMRSIRDYLAQEVEGLYRDQMNNPDMKREWNVLEDYDATLKVILRDYKRVVQKCSIVDNFWLSEKLRGGNTILFEGAQGVLLDQDYGFDPHTTWTDCTFGNAYKLLDGFQGDITKVGVLRGYMTRHGAGPLVTEDASLTAPGEHNQDNPWQQGFRLGHFDTILAKYALRVVGGVHFLALTCLDHLQGEIKSCIAYRSSVGRTLFDGLPLDNRPPRQGTQRELGHVLGFLKPIYQTFPDLPSFVNHVEKELKTPVKLCSFGPKASDKGPRDSSYKGSSPPVVLPTMNPLVSG
jgi:adenylosuccinate synthase